MSRCLTNVLAVFVMTFFASASGCSSASSRGEVEDGLVNCSDLERDFTQINLELEDIRDEQGVFKSVLASRVTAAGKKIRKLELQQEILRKELQSTCGTVA